MPARPYYDAKAIVTGFRDTGTGNLSQKLMKVIVDKFNHQACIDQFAEKYNESTMLCYGHHTERKDTCIVSLDKGCSLGSVLGVRIYF